jgi:cold shock CspA family protein
MVRYRSAKGRPTMTWFWRNREKQEQSEEIVPPPMPLSEEPFALPDVDLNAQAAATTDEEEELAGPGVLSGTVDWFKHDKGFGGIKPDRALNLKGERFLFFHIKDVVGDTSNPLVQGEPLRFKLATDPKGPPAAVSVERIAVYARGTMTKWLDSKMYGFATIDDEHRTEVFVHLKDIAGKKWLKQGDKIGFFIASTQDGQRLRALSVRRLESRNALKEFADIEKLEHGSLLAQLAKMAQDEDWSYKNDQSGRKHPIL